MRSNTRGVYRHDDDDRWAAEHPEGWTALGKTSGFERMDARVTRLSFGGMARHLTEL